MGDTMQTLENACWAPYAALDNSLGQNPCEIAHLLFKVCDNQDSFRDDYNLYPLDLDKGQHRYPPPNQWQATSCICSMAGYNLVQACAACQQPTAIQSTLWNDWVSNCTMSNINFARTFPFNIPETTVLPDWAYANNAHGSLDMADIFRRISSNTSKWPFNPDSNYSLVPDGSSTSRLSTTTIDTTAAYGEATVGSTSTSTPDEPDADADDSGPSSKNVVIGILVPVIVIGALLAGVFAYLRRKKRKLRQRGLRLGSDGNLPAPIFVDPSMSNPFSDSLHPVMTQHKDSHVSLFLPSETVFTRPSSRSRSSFTTNSVSTASYVAAQNARRGTGARRHDPYDSRDSSVWGPPSTAYDSRSSAAYTYDDDDEDEELDGGDPYSPHPVDESISPFADINRPPRSLVATRNNLHNIRSTRSRSTFYDDEEDDRSIDENDSMLSRTTGGTGRGRGGDVDVESLITLSSRVSKLSRVPSSSGATYGGAHDDEEEEEDGFTTERGEDDDDGFTTEQVEDDDEVESRGRTSLEVEDDGLSLRSGSIPPSPRPPH